MADEEEAELQAALSLSMERRDQPMEIDQDEEAREIREAISLSMQPQPPSLQMLSSQEAEEAELKEALALSMTNAHPAILSAASLPTPSTVGSSTAIATEQRSPEPLPSAKALCDLIFGGASRLVSERWISQGLVISPPMPVEGGLAFSAGLQQEHGGPCAVLAASQAFLLRRLLFDPHTAPQPLPPAAPLLPEAAAERLAPSAADATEMLCRGLADVLWQATGAEAAEGGGRCAIVALLPPEVPLPGLDAEDEFAPMKLIEALLTAHATAHSWEATHRLLQERFSSLASPVGALALLLSAILSRGMLQFNEERDDASQPLLDPAFGHCSQEALNLMLVGRGVSNVFDGEQDLGGGLVLRGVPSRPAVGFISQMEALRYLEVGSFYKKPHAPIWVLASESHFTILFALSAVVHSVDAIAAAEEQLHKAFCALDSDGLGFIGADKIEPLLAALPEWEAAADVLRSQVDDGILLWDTFQRVMLPLHPAAAAQREKAEGAEAQPAAAELALYHYNGLRSAGHAHKQCLRSILLRPGAASGQPQEQHGLAACLQTRWKNAAITWEGSPPSIN